MRIDPEGLKLSIILIGCAAAMWILAAGAGWTAPKWLAALLLAAGLFSLMFFRDPDRRPPTGKEIAISAADGVVVDVGPVRGGNPGDGGGIRIAVFMNVFNVHVNRSPVDGVVTETSHHDGKKLSVLNGRAEYENEHADTVIDTPSGTVRVRQIAGLIARRIVTRVQADDTLRAGDRIGLIRFGSRVDVFLPEGYEPAVRPGDRVRAGETVIAHMFTRSDKETGGFPK